MSRSKLEKGASYIFAEKLPIRSYKVYSSFVEKGYEGLCLSEIEPKLLREKLNLKTPAIWVTKGDYPDIEAISPRRLAKLSTVIAEFLKAKRTKDKIILIDCLGYIMENNDFNSVMKFLQLVNEYVVLNDAILIIPLNVKSLGSTQIGFLEREFNVMDEKDLASKSIAPGSTLENKSDSA